jgi:hypothetical protein
MPKYNTRFELGLQDIDHIEVSLTKRVGELTRKMMASDRAPVEDDSARLHDEIKQLRQLLGKLHEQKVWYEPEGYHPRG